MQPRLLVFASGGEKETEGGSGFENLVLSAKEDINLHADIVGVVSNHEHGGVRTRAEKLGVDFYYFPKPWTAERYRGFVLRLGASFVALSGWLKLVQGLDPRTMFNIHPGPLPLTAGMYGHHVHEAVIEAYRRGEITHSAVTMHFVTEEYDKGPVFFTVPIEILPEDTAESLGKRVNAKEHEWQPVMTNKVLSGETKWDGKNPSTLFGAMLMSPNRIPKKS
jgi:folate-dependent phosphoribosylglycinamide formyltransferase PurN